MALDTRSECKFLIPQNFAFRKEDGDCLSSVIARLSPLTSAYRRSEKSPPHLMLSIQTGSIRFRHCALLGEPSEHCSGQIGRSTHWGPNSPFCWCITVPTEV